MTAPTDLTGRPALYAGVGSEPTSWAEVAATDEEAGEPFYAASDNGATWTVRSRVIPVDALRLATGGDPAAVATQGLFSAGRNPAPAVSLPTGTFTEIEFAVRATVDAAWESAYALPPLPGRAGDRAGGCACEPRRLRRRSTCRPGQKPGVLVEEPVPAYRLMIPTGAVTAQPRLRPAPAATGGLGQPLGSAVATPRRTCSTGSLTDSCAACHSAHRAHGASAPARPRRPYPPCASGATTARAHGRHPGPVRDPRSPRTTRPRRAATRTRRQPRPTTPSTGWMSSPGSNRHAECADCHQPHLSDATTATTAGWTVGGDQGRVRRRRLQRRGQHRSRLHLTATTSLSTSSASSATPGIRRSTRSSRASPAAVGAGQSGGVQPG